MIGPDREIPLDGGGRTRVSRRGDVVVRETARPGPDGTAATSAVPAGSSATATWRRGTSSPA
ncbi:MAG TPA: hypothetical protein VEM58_13995, partial [Streptosporangiaceae bacterium]|nr:hypothetical protein [Streptosporangiaceae bacterium]